MSGKKEKMMRRAMAVVGAMNAAGITDRDAIAERIGRDERVRALETSKRKART